MKISIIIPVYNVEPYVERCIRSVLAQDYTGGLECIVVDDRSPDGSMEIVRKITDGYRGPINVRIESHAVNQGLSAARNTGIRHATGDYLYFLDSDDEITPDCISRLAALATKYPDVDIVQGNIVVTDEFYRFLDISRYDFPEYSADKEWIRTHMLEDIPVIMCSRLIRRGFILENDLWCMEGLIHEDEHWRFSAFMLVRSMAFCNHPSYIYYRNESGISENKFKDRSADSMLRIYDEFLDRLAGSPYYAKVLYLAIWFATHGMRLKDRDKFLRRYNALLLKQLHNTSVPLKIRAAIYDMMHPSMRLKAVCRIVWRPAYRQMKRLSRINS